VTTEPRRPYYDKAAHQAAIRQSEAVVRAALEALKRALGFGTCIIIGTDGKPYKRIT